MAATTLTTRPRVAGADAVAGAPDETELVRIAEAGAARPGRRRSSVPVGFPTSSCATFSCV